MRKIKSKDLWMYELRVVVDDYGNIFYSQAEYDAYKSSNVQAWKLAMPKLIHATVGLWPIPKTDKRARPKRPNGYWKKLSTTTLDYLYPYKEGYGRFVNKEILLLWESDNLHCFRSREFLKAVSTWACTPHNKRLYRTLKRLDAFK